MQPSSRLSRLFFNIRSSVSFPVAISVRVFTNSSFIFKDKPDRSGKTTKPSPKSNTKQPKQLIQVSSESNDTEDVDETPLPPADPKDLKASLNRLVESYKRELSKLRGATASPGMLDSIIVEAYGERQPLTSLAQISLKSPNLLVINPFDSALSQQIAEAIRAVEELNLNPSVDGQIVNVPVPKTSKETREATAKLVSKAAEGAKVRVRRLRQAALERLKKQTEGSSEDDIRRESRVIDDQVSAVITEVSKLADIKRLEVEKV